jgi:hypothetical protein
VQPQAVAGLQLKLFQAVAYTGLQAPVETLRVPIIIKVIINGREGSRLYLPCPFVKTPGLTSMVASHEQADVRPGEDL